MSNNVDFAVEESADITGISMRPMAAAMRPYSIAVAPRVSCE